MNQKLFKSIYTGIPYCILIMLHLFNTFDFFFFFRYFIDQMAENKGFIVDVKVSICFPLDDENICIPTEEGLHLLQKEEIPVCDQRALVNFQSMFI